MPQPSLTSIAGWTVLFTLQIHLCAAQPIPAGTPDSLGFRHFYKCPSDADVTPLGDTGTAEACLTACEARRDAAGCWWLDGTGGFPRECRLCRTLSPRRQVFPNDWALPLSAKISRASP